MLLDVCAGCDLREERRGWLPNFTVVGSSLNTREPVNTEIQE